VEREPKFLQPAFCDGTGANRNRKQRLIVTLMMLKKVHFKVEVMSDSFKSFVVNDSMPKARSEKAEGAECRIMKIIRVLPVVPLGAESATKALTFFPCR
jgi:hypothetical protein